MSQKIRTDSQSSFEVKHSKEAKREVRLNPSAWRGVWARTELKQLASQSSGRTRKDELSQ